MFMNLFAIGYCSIKFHKKKKKTQLMSISKIISKNQKLLYCNKLYYGAMSKKNRTQIKR